VSAPVTRTAALIALAALALCSCAWCQSPGDRAGSQDIPYNWEPVAADAPDVGAESASGPAYLSILDALGKLLIAVVIAWGLVHAVRWWQETRGGADRFGGAADRQMCVEETLSLGADGRLHLVEVAGRRLLLASHEGAVRQIAELTEVAPDDREEPGPSAYRSVRRRADGSSDEVNVARAPISTRPVRADVVRESENWEQRRGRLLRELQEN